jgi:lipoprotein-anchoring transpeptidase ErfK/SrfK
MLSANCHGIVTRTSLLRAAAAGLAVASVAGCGGTKPSHSVHPPKRSRVCSVGSFQRYGSSRLAFAAIVRDRAEALRRPGGAPIGRFGRMNQNGVRMVLSVRGARVDRSCAPTWYFVQLPIRPNGTTGWVRASQLEVGTVTSRIEVDLSARRVTLFRNGRRVLSATAAIGSRATPTPTGSYYVNQRLIPSDPGGPFGPGAVGISAFSNVLTGWTQGGPIAIHGTNAPWSIGKAVSNGCIRIPNTALKKLFDQALSGTPVLIRN